MLEDVVDRLRCPHCGDPLHLAGSVLGCDRGHRYDVARQGYVSLLPPRGRAAPGDNPAMVAARAAFLDAGHYAPLAAAAAEAAQEAAPLRAGGAGCVADLGAGTGHHLARLLAALPGWVGLALDSAPAALRRAVRAHARIGAVVCDVWRPLPVRDGAADLVVNVFAPRNGGEIARVLAPDGAVIVVTPAARHLAELAGRLGMLRVETGKSERLEAQLAPLGRTRRRDLAFPLALSRADARALATMGPSAHHLRPDDLERAIADLPEPFEVTAAVTVETFQRR